MTGRANRLQLTEFDMMVIRAGGRTLAEQEERTLNAADFRCRLCAILADALYQIVMRLETGANRSLKGSHRRLVSRAVR